MNTQEMRERFARAIARAVTLADDVDVLVVAAWPGLPVARGGFVVIPAPENTAPLWTFFLPAADAAIAEALDILDL